MRTLPTSVAEGNQLPTEMVVPKSVDNDVLDTIDLLAEAGLELMDWQAVLLECWMGVNADGRWAAPTCGNQTPRQNGKTRVIQGRAATEMLFYDGTVIYTAQIQKTSTETFEETASLFDTPALRKFLAPHGIRTALGREEIRLKSGAKMKFLARTKNGGNGQHGSLLLFDEAQYLDPVAQGSFLAAISACRTKRGPQTIYNGNAPEATDAAVVFNRIREDALSGKTTRTSWTSWSPPSTMGLPDVADRDLWERMNPSLGILISPDVVEAEFEAEDAEQFAHQRLGWFRPCAVRAESLIREEQWRGLVADSPDSWDKLAYGVRFSVDGSTVSLSVCVTRGDRAHVEFIREEPTQNGVGWLVSWLTVGDESRAGMAASIVIDGRADATDLALQIVAAGAPRNAVVVAKSGDAMTAAGMLVNAVNDGTLTHPDDLALDESALGAIRRPIGRAGGFGFGGECPQRIDSCALALFGARTSKRDPSRKAVVW